jgi:hypothetical protein
MENGIQKLLRKLVLKKYPVYLDVHVSENGRFHPNRKICYEVFLITFDDDWKSMENSVAREVKEYIKNLAKYMSVSICGVYNESVTKEEWEEMKLDETPPL